MELNEIKHYLGTGLKMWSDEAFPFGESEFDKHTIKLEHWNIAGAVDGKIKPIMRPLSDLVKPCLEGGKIPIVELAEIAFPKCSAFELSNNERVNMGMGYSFGYRNMDNSFDCKRNFNEKTWDYNCFVPNQLALFDWLYEHHFWLGDQSRFGKDIIDINTLTVK